MSPSRGLVIAAAFAIVITGCKDNAGPDDDPTTTEATNANGSATADGHGDTGGAEDAVPVAGTMNMPEQFPDDITLPDGDVSSYMAFADADGKNHILTMRMDGDPAEIIADIKQDYDGDGFNIVTESQDVQDSDVIAGFVWTNSKWFSSGLCG